ncbi:hypothetical protein ABIA33_002987 [Streptacidiphilus sp. MAP12-16]
MPSVVTMLGQTREDHQHHGSDNLCDRDDPSAGHRC